MARTVRANGQDHALLCGDAIIQDDSYRGGAWDIMVKHAKSYLIPQTYADRWFGFKHYLEVEGRQPVVCAAAEWNPKPAANGIVCCRAPVLFQPENEGGLMPWDRRANGAIVAAIRGHASIEQMALNAKAAGAIGLVVVDNGPEAEFSTWFDVIRDGSGGETAPDTPTVVVSGELRSTLCGGENAAIVHATITCR